MSRLVIIGAGFSGTVAAIEFMRRAPKGAEVVLINRSGKMARGLAYGTSSQHHLLNVPAGNMSALFDEPDSFLSFCQLTQPETHSGSFVSRAIYGAYLEHLLASVEVETANRVSCRRVTGNVVSIEKRGEGVVLQMTSGALLEADHVILAFGNFAPQDPIEVDRVESRTTYVSDPWSAGAELVHPGARRILLVGTGLTAIDVMLSIKRLSPETEIIMLSRRGLSPKGHRERLPDSKFATDIQGEMLSAFPSARAYLRVVREHVARSQEHWREVITALRPITPELWSRLSVMEKKRFLRHVQAYWDIHRHRMAPETHRAFEERIAEGSVRVIAGRIETVSFAPNAARVGVRMRGNQKSECLLVDKVINCTGPCTGISKINDGLISDLVKNDVLSSDMLGLGINVDIDYSLLNAVGQKTPWLSYIGPMLRAHLWEATAVPELRFHAKKLAVIIADHFKSTQSADPLLKRP